VSPVHLLGVPHVFEAEQWIPAPLEPVFRYFCDPRNLAVISPPSSGARLKQLSLVPPPGDFAGRERMAGTGSEIVLSVRLLPYLPLRASWTARIVEFDWLQRFRDIQVSGPFQQFEHTHSFAVAGRNGQPGTIVRDHVEYSIGFGPLGALANALVVARSLRQMFDYRHRATAHQFRRS